MDKKNYKNFDQISTKLEQALSEFENIKNSEKKNTDSLVNESKAQKTLIKNIKSLINDLS